MTLPARLLTTITIALAALPAGVAASTPTPYVVGGTEVEPGELPFMLEIEYRLEGTSEWHHLCGATLIRADVVMTAAHCIVDPGTGEPYEGLESRLVLGRVDRADPAERVVGQANYQPVIHSRRDLAVLMLDRDIPDVPVVSLPVSGVLPVTGSQATVAGWGYTEHALPSEYLRWAALDIIDPTRCDTPHWRVDGTDFPLLCAWSPDAGGGAGDSGGPLLQRDVDGGGYRQIGVVSGGRMGYPDAYVNLAEPTLWDEFDAPLDWPPTH